MPKDKMTPMDESAVLKALYHMYCAAAYKGSVTMSSETAIGLYNFFNSQKAEIERLQTEKENLRCVIEDLSNNTEHAKFEAIKEFAERLKERIHIKEIRDVYGKKIDNLVKEMVGDV